MLNGAGLSREMWPISRTETVSLVLEGTLNCAFSPLSPFQKGPKENIRSLADTDNTLSYRSPAKIDQITFDSCSQRHTKVVFS
jgi:hypothetical protein